ncbi:small Trp-rich protein [Lampropedia hyalina DSM 16112]|jgi:small Trp-rich protein|uniref:Small Trp-rich protein n=1 Tax=Lampropedia hyalina DSM 16112 TaxID=1122156 RepID=A0A1M5EWE8_9BURK|nr:TIGR04438 family Trp-rich protein [Lampropedia hyalina]SHF83499.1 small Trp-rich protein [Lampropedia hyalina DSM 16112]
MYLFGLALILLLLKFLEIGPVAQWSWWIIVIPFALTAAWWTWADASGYTRRKAIERENQRKADRVQRQREKMGLPGKRRP